MQTDLTMAVPVHANRVSPLFDTATTLLIVKISNGEEKERRFIPIEHQPSPTRPKYIEHLGVNVLVCGAISASLHRQIEFLKIQVIPCIAGDADDVVAAYIGKRLLKGQGFMMPGCGGKKKRHRGGCGGASQGRGCGGARDKNIFSNHYTGEEQ